MLCTKVRAHVTQTLQEVRMMSYTIRVKTQTNTLKTETQKAKTSNANVSNGLIGTVTNTSLLYRQKPRAGYQKNEGFNRST